MRQSCLQFPRTLSAKSLIFSEEIPTLLAKTSVRIHFQKGPDTEKNLPGRETKKRELAEKRSGRFFLQTLPASVLGNFMVAIS